MFTHRASQSQAATEMCQGKCHVSAQQRAAPQRPSSQRRWKACHQSHGGSPPSGSFPPVTPAPTGSVRCYGHSEVCHSHAHDGPGCCREKLPAGTPHCARALCGSPSPVVCVGCEVGDLQHLGVRLVLLLVEADPLLLVTDGAHLQRGGAGWPGKSRVGLLPMASWCPPGGES